jgi:hypothetical protein
MIVHVSAMLELPIWIAVSTAISATGKFLDDFHIRNETKSRLRSFLIQKFIALESIRIPDPARETTRLIASFARSRGLLVGLAFCGIAYVSLIGVFYYGRAGNGVPYGGSFGDYLSEWVPHNAENLAWTIILGFLIGGGLLGIGFSRWTAIRVSRTASHQGIFAHYLLLVSGLIFLGCFLYLMIPRLVFFLIVEAMGNPSAKIVSTRAAIRATLVLVALPPCSFLL